MALLLAAVFVLVCIGVALAVMGARLAAFAVAASFFLVALAAGATLVLSRGREL